MKQKMIYAGVICVLALLFGGCGADQTAPSADASESSQSSSASESDAEARTVIGIVVKDNSKEYWGRIQSAAQQVCDANDVELLFLADTASTDPEGQIKKTDELTAEGVDAICVSPISDEMLIPAMKRAEEAGIPVFAVDSDSSFSGKTAYIGTDHYEAAKAGAVYAAEQTGAGAKAVILRDTVGDKTHDDRQKGIQDGLAEGGITVEKVLCTDEINARADMKKLLKMYPDLDLVMTTQDILTVEAWTAVKESGRNDIYIYGFDGSTEAAELTAENPQVIGTMAQDPEEIGRQCVETVLAYLNGSEIDAVVNTPWQIINEENAAEYTAELHALEEN